MKYNSIQELGVTKIIFCECVFLYRCFFSIYMSGMREKAFVVRNEELWLIRTSSCVVWEWGGIGTYAFHH